MGRRRLRGLRGREQLLRQYGKDRCRAEPHHRISLLGHTAAGADRFHPGAHRLLEILRVAGRYLAERLRLVLLLYMCLVVVLLFLGGDGGVPGAEHLLGGAREGDRLDDVRRSELAQRDLHARLQPVVCGRRGGRALEVDGVLAHGQGEAVAVLQRQLPRTRVPGRRVDPHRRVALDADDRVIETAEPRQAGVDVRSRACRQQRDARPDAQRAQHGDQERRLVLAVTVAAREHLRRFPRHDRGVAELDAGVTNGVSERGQQRGDRATSALPRGRLAGERRDVRTGQLLLDDRMVVAGDAPP